jgi:phenylpropionate dioxygenase-like ring-hydroxylating dioxygenase large terminal subunit
MLRRYWWPIGICDHLKSKPTLVRLLGENLVLFRDGAGKPGLLAALCSHRRANLCLGDVEADGLRCRYHGWKYAVDGKVIEIPGEPAAERIARQVHHLSYPVVEHGGGVFAYLGPPPVPLLPQFDFLVREGVRTVRIGGFSDSNWLQCVENGMDPTHVSFAHRDALTDLGDFPTKIEFERTEHGMIHKTYRPGDGPGRQFYREHHLVMPGISVTGAGQRRVEGGDNAPAVSGRWTVPIDDHESMMFSVFFKPAENVGSVVRTTQDRPLFGTWAPVTVQPFREYRGLQPEPLGYEIPASVPAQDATLLDSMGPIVDRENEFLVSGDEPIVLLRKLFLDAIDTVSEGRDPPGVFRHPTIVAVPAHERMISAPAAA